MHLAVIHHPIWLLAGIMVAALLIACAAFVAELIDTGKDIDNDRGNP